MMDNIIEGIEGHLDTEKGERFEGAVFNSGIKGI